MRLGRLNCLRTDAAATASGGATMAPRAMAAHHGSSGTIHLATTATAPALKNTAPMANSKIGRKLDLKAGQSVRYALACSKGGKNSAKASSGLSSIVGKPGTKASAIPPRISGTATGRFRRCASMANATQKAINTKRSSKVTMQIPESAPRMAWTEQLFVSLASSKGIIKRA